MIKRLQKRYALSEQGAKDLVKGCLACVLQNLSFMSVSYTHLTLPTIA